MDKCSMDMSVVSPWVPRVSAFWAPPLIEMPSHSHHVACFHSHKHGQSFGF